MLYIATGDRGEDARAQRPAISRARSCGCSPTGACRATIPSSAVRAIGPRSGRPAIATCRGFAIDARDGALWVAEHGPRGGDDSTWSSAGSITAGRGDARHRVRLGTADRRRHSRQGMEDPVHVWVPDLARPFGPRGSTTARLPGWRGDLLVGMLQTRAIHRLTLRDGRVTNEERLIEGQGRIRDVRVGPDGFRLFPHRRARGRLRPPRPGELTARDFAGPRGPRFLDEIARVAAAPRPRMTVLGFFRPPPADSRSDRGISERNGARIAATALGALSVARPRGVPRLRACRPSCRRRKSASSGARARDRNPCPAWPPRPPRRACACRTGAVVGQVATSQ
jgi:hypothetical protein